MFIAIVPAYNEEKRIAQVVSDLLKSVDSVIVVDDKSRDNTIGEATQSGAMVLQHKINLGQGAALETGHEYARSIGVDYVLHFDGDGQFCVEDIAPALEKLKESKADILFGSRFLDNRSKVPFLKKYFLLPIGRFINKLFGVVSLKDSQNGFRILNRNALEKIKITQNGMAHATEIMGLTRKHNLNYVEFPVKVIYHEYGQGIGGGLKIVKDLFLGKFLK
ncbi:MAG: glycosyltransferase family 2 protein [Candidatus Magasanikbacteria bacterium CG_4_10_14_0_2_um_filter_33_14]|uniref:Glycosyltransferase family 2 protein n=1 Tax=Candidatus Magasanikbacteria bacterium CG_4_10_14_0_2_um_filter_33_14 TaxID=1974636 RepID=A0A2M7V818_9BACT|nr:MAG: glycosyltransferase family 2 protein [Candidatus Magasanikbacteria bacterium CG_4_10_14_0_2_um_filter_33_14]